MLSEQHCKKAKNCVSGLLRYYRKKTRPLSIKERSEKKEEYNYYKAISSLFGIFTSRLADSFERNLKELKTKSKIDP